MFIYFNVTDIGKAYIGCPFRYRTRYPGGPLLRVATIRRTTDTHYRHTLQTHTTDTFLSISHTTNVLLFKFRCNIFIGVRISKEMPGLVASGTPYTFGHFAWTCFCDHRNVLQRCLHKLHCYVTVG